MRATHAAQMTETDTETKIINFRPPRRMADPSWRRGAALLAFWLGILAAALVVLNWQLVPGLPPLKAGDTAPETLRAPRRATFVSQTRTRALRDQAAAQVSYVYDYDSNLLRQLRGRSADLLRSLSAIRADSSTPIEARRQQIIRLEPGLSPSSVDAVLTLSDPEWLAVNAEGLRILDENVRERIRADELAERRAAAIAQINPALSPEQRSLVADLVSLYTRPNVLVNQAETEKARKEARERIAPVQVTVERGDIIVRQGDVITDDDVEKLEALGLGRRAFDLQRAAGIAVYTSLLTLLLSLYLYLFHVEVFNRPRSALLIAIILVGSLAAMKLVIPGRPFAAYAFPIAVATMLVSNLLATPMAVVIGVFLALLAAPILGFSYEIVFLFAIQAVVGALAARRIERLNAFFVAGLQVTLANLAVVLGFALVNQDYDWLGVANLGAAAVVNGLLSAILTMGTFSVVGSLSGLTTMLQLLELAHPSQPLLRRLLTEAPGTYHHSIIVGNLAERAAELIGVDSLLVRVGSYYHDIGKLRRPYYFIENQLEGENIHDRLRPEASAQALTEHRSHGLELAKQYGLPPAVQDIIAQHHGTRLTIGFYRKAVKLAGADSVDEAGFRYAGPKPQRKETALVMLADTVEATVRSASDRSTQTLDRLVERTVNELVLEGQLDECDLTLKDLERIKRSFTRQLQGVYHPRIEYPEPQELEAVQVPLAEPS
ncbi:MAG: HDIG domain-containing protein [Chloroflexi bacterium]|nr:HDIG domain-containing protein [Chloroflexota bacterium]